MIQRCVAYGLLACIAFGASCSKPAVESYRIPKETAKAAAPEGGKKESSPTPGPTATRPGGQMANTPVATASGPGLVWTAPAHWSQKEAGAMRKATYSIKADGVTGEAILSVTAFPGDVGGDLANLNRWRGQLDLPPVTEAQFESSTQHVDRNDLHMTVVDIVGTGATAQRILGAMVPHGGSTWFFKLMGPDAIVVKEKAAFASFLDTIKAAPAAK